MKKVGQEKIVKTGTTGNVQHRECGNMRREGRPHTEAQLEAVAVEREIELLTESDDGNVAEELSALQGRLSDLNREARSDALADFIDRDPWKAMKALRKPNTTSTDQLPDLAAINATFQAVSTNPNHTHLHLLQSKYLLLW